MVFYSQVAKTNLSDILTGLISWQNHPLEISPALKYVSEIRQVCDQLDTKSFHFNARFTLHKRYGEKVHTYRRSKNTVWYIIYNLDQHGNIYIQRIISNYNTITEF